MDDIESNPLERIQKFQNSLNMNGNQPSESTPGPPTITGPIPSGLQKLMEEKNSTAEQHSDDASSNRPTPQPQKPVQQGMNDGSLQDVLAKIASVNQYEEVHLPSQGKFYEDIPSVLHIRPMTGEEENILATARFVKSGRAINMIFENVIREKINVTKLLAEDQQYLLIYLRAISYTNRYEVEVGCPNCDRRFQTSINLSDLDLTICPDDFGPEDLSGTLPRTKLAYKYRFATGEDDQAVSRHRDLRLKEFGDSAEDDTIIYRSALLLDYIDQCTSTTDLLVLLKRLPLEDVNYIRNLINDPPFGVNTEVGMSCPSCMMDFETKLRLFDENFFFPKTRKTK